MMPIRVPKSWTERLVKRMYNRLALEECRAVLFKQEGEVVTCVDQDYTYAVKLMPVLVYWP